MRIYSSIDQQHRFKGYAYGSSAPICIGRNQAPPFQLVYPLDAADINSVRLVRMIDDLETEIYTEMVTAGLKTVDFPAYKILKWRANTTIPIALQNEGRYYLIFSNGVYSWYSEEFTMKANLSGHWRIEYCHGENFPLPGTGHIDYTEGYKNFFYVDTEIGKPAYGYEEEVKRRDGQNLPLQQIRFKSHRFALILPEEVADAMSLIPLHDVVTISKGEVEYEVDEITMSAEWQELGDLAVCEFEFRTDTVVVVNGRGVEETGCPETSCFPWAEVIHEAVAFIYEGEAEWDGAYYTTPLGGTVDLEEGDQVVVYRRASPYTDQIQLMEYTAGTFVILPTNPGELVYEANTGQYFYDNNLDSLQRNYIISINGDEVTGESIPLSIVEIYALFAGGGELLVGVTDAFTFTDEPFEIDTPAGIVALRMVVSTAECPRYYIGPWIYLDPLELVSCAGDYASDAAAIADGVTAGDMYCLTADNIYGLPVGVVKQLDPYTGYPSNMAALLALGQNVVFPVSTDNNMGLPGGVLRINVDSLSTYDDDTAAAAGGVAVGEFYIRNYIDAGFPPYLITKRLA